MGLKSLLLLGLLATISWVVRGELVSFGQSAALSGERYLYGTSMESGMRIAFMEANATAVFPNLTLNLTTLDDQYDPILSASNTEWLVSSHNVLALLGYTGTTATLESLHKLEQLGRRDVPLVGALSGAKELRVPFKPNVINLRASFIDEGGAIVKFLVSKQYTKVAVLYQNDAAGMDVVSGVNASLIASELHLEADGWYEKSTENYVPGVDRIFNGHHIQAVVCVGQTDVIANAISYAQKYADAKTAIWFSTSYMDAREFATLMKVNFNASNWLRLYSTQVVPNPKTTTNMPLVNSFMQASATYMSTLDPSFKSFEGYIVGRFVIEVLERIRGAITPTSFLQAIYRTSVFSLDNYVLGPYGNSSYFQCNHGAREVFLHSISSAGSYTLVPDFSFKWTDTCLSSKSSIFQSKRLIWGQSADLTGERRELGLDISYGISAAFDEANRLNIVPGYKFDLQLLDDANDVARARQNTLDFFDNYKVMGLVGFTGTSTSNAALDVMANNRTAIPFVGPLSGDSSFRVPFRRHVLNLRASFIDEATAMVNFLSNALISRISVVYEDSGTGHAAYDAILVAIKQAGMLLESNSTFDPHVNGAVNAAMQEALVGHEPGAIIVVGLDNLVAEAISFGHNFTGSKYGKEAIYVTFSTVGVDFLTKELRARFDNFNNIYMTQTFPHPADLSSVVAARFADASALYNPDHTVSIESIEGYLNGLFIVEVCSRIRDEITSESFLQAVYESQLFVIDKEKLGPFYDENSVGNAFLCNQGYKQVFMSRLYPTNYTMVPSLAYSWSDSCLSGSDDILAPVVFGQSAALTGVNKHIGINLRSGILAAFNRFNRNGGLDGRMVKLKTYDDAYDSAKAANNTVEMTAEGVVALLGFTGTGPSAEATKLSTQLNIPVIAPYTGAIRFRKPCQKYVVNVRSSYYDEEAAMVTFLVDPKYESLRENRTFNNIAMFYQQDSLDDYVSGVVTAMTYYKKSLKGLGWYPRSTTDVVPGLQNITKAYTDENGHRNSSPDAVIVYGILAPALEFLKEAKKEFGEKTVYLILSFAGATTITESLKNISYPTHDATGKPTVYITTVVPSPTDPSHPLAAEYLAEVPLQNPYVPPNYISLEGYAIGRFVTRALQLAEGGITRRSLTDAIYEKFMFNLNEYYLGPYTLNTANTARNRSSNATEDLTCSCSQGSHQVWLNYISDDYNVTQLKYDFIFDTCGAEFQVYYNQLVDVGIRGLVLALAVLAIVVVVVCAILVLVYRQTKTMTASSPVFLMIILLGALIMSMSPFFAVGWGDEGTGADSICMTWIWFLGLGFTLFFAPLAVKTYRVYRIFNNRVLSHVITLKDSDLMLYLAVPVVLEVILLIVWTAVAPAKLLTVRIPGTVDQTMNLCSTVNGGDQPFIIAQAVLFGLVAVAACFFAFRTRNIKYGAFKESTEILFAAYNLTFLSVILVPLHAGLTYYVIPSTIIRTIGVVFQVLVSLGALFGMKLYRIITNNEKMSTTTRRSGYSSRGPLSFSSTSGSSHSHGKTSTTTTTTSSKTSSSPSSKSSRSTTTSSTTRSSSTGTTTTTTTTTSSSSSDSDSDSSSSSPSSSSQASKQKSKAAASAAKPAPKPAPKHMAPGQAMNDSVMTEPSTEESDEPAPPKPEKKGKHHRHHDESDEEGGAELQEFQHDEDKPKPKKSSLMPKWLSPKDKDKKEEKDEVIFFHDDGKDGEHKEEEPVAAVTKQKKKKYDDKAKKAEAEPLSPKKPDEDDAELH